MDEYGRIDLETIEDIADAIRAKKQTEDTYFPSDFADAINEIKVMPDLEYRFIHKPGIFLPHEGYEGMNKAKIEIDEQGIEQSSIYIVNSMDSNVIIASNRLLNSSGFVNKILLDSILETIDNNISRNSATISIDSVESIDENSVFLCNADDLSPDITMFTSMTNTTFSPNTLTGSDLIEALKTKPSNDFIQIVCNLINAKLEYKNNVYGNTALINECHLNLLGDFASASGSSKTVELNDSISNYTAIILNGIYRGQRNSSYNTTMVYIKPKLNERYWTGMQDRNKSYDCYVTFQSDTSCLLNGSSYSQCIIYGIP